MSNLFIEIRLINQITVYEKYTPNRVLSPYQEKMQRDLDKYEDSQLEDTTQESFDFAEDASTASNSSSTKPDNDDSFNPDEYFASNDAKTE